MSALMATWLTGGVTHRHHPRHHHRQHHRHHRSHHQCHHHSNHQGHHHHHYLGPYLTIFVCRIISGLYEKKRKSCNIIVLIFGIGANFRRFYVKFGRFVLILRVLDVFFVLIFVRQKVHCCLYLPAFTIQKNDCQS